MTLKLRIFLMLRALRHRWLIRKNSRAQGGHWERVAEGHLKSQGLRTITRNWRYRRGELDLVMWDGEILVFVEVRARAAHALVQGYHSITRRKRDILRQTCRAYLRRLSDKPRHYRFDVVQVRVGPGGNHTIEHFTNVPLFSRR